MPKSYQFATPVYRVSLFIGLILLGFSLTSCSNDDDDGSTLSGECQECTVLRTTIGTNNESDQRSQYTTVFCDQELLELQAEDGDTITVSTPGISESYVKEIISCQPLP